MMLVVLDSADSHYTGVLDQDDNDHNRRDNSHYHDNHQGYHHHGEGGVAASVGDSSLSFRRLECSPGRMSSLPDARLPARRPGDRGHSHPISRSLQAMSWELAPLMFCGAIHVIVRGCL